MQKIFIKNFGPIKDLELEVKNFNLLIGEQATGKSTIAKLIYAFKSLKNEFQFYLYNYNIGINNNKFDQTIILYALILKLDKEIFEDVNDPFSIVYQYGPNKYLTAVKNTEKLSAGFSSLPFKSNNNESDFNHVYLDLCERIFQFREKYLKSNSYLTEIENLDFKNKMEAERTILIKLINQFFEDDKELVYIPAGRTTYSILSDQLVKLDTNNLDFITKDFFYRINRTKGSFSKPLHDIYKDLQNFDVPQNLELPSKEAFDLASKYINSILKGSYLFDGSDGYISIENNKTIRLKNASSGQQESIWILLFIFTILMRKDKVFLIIEEPEAHLYPVAQKQMVELITLLINQNEGSQVMITTHSPYILAAFNNLIYANQVGADKREEVSKIIDPLVWIDLNKVTANEVAKGKLVDLVDEEQQIIKVEEIDRVSTELNAEFDQIFNLEEV